MYNTRIYIHYTLHAHTHTHTHTHTHKHTPGAKEGLYAYWLRLYEHSGEGAVVTYAGLNQALPALGPREGHTNPLCVAGTHGKII